MSNPKLSPRIPQPQPATEPVLAPAELIRTKLDAGFAAVQAGKMRSQSGAADAAKVAKAQVERTVTIVREAIQSAHLTESQLAVVNKKIQALKDAADRIN